MIEPKLIAHQSAHFINRSNSSENKHISLHHSVLERLPAFDVDDAPEAIGGQESEHSHHQGVGVDGLDRLHSLRDAEGRLVVKAEGQQVDRSSDELDHRRADHLRHSLASLVRHSEFL